MGKQVLCIADPYAGQVFPHSITGLFPEKPSEIFLGQAGMSGQERKGNIFRIIFLDIIHGLADGFLVEQPAGILPDR